MFSKKLILIFSFTSYTYANTMQLYGVSGKEYYDVEQFDEGLALLSALNLVHLKALFCDDKLKPNVDKKIMHAESFEV